MPAPPSHSEVSLVFIPQLWWLHLLPSVIFSLPPGPQGNLLEGFLGAQHGSGSALGLEEGWRDKRTLSSLLGGAQG